METETIIAFAATIIALSALFVSVWQALQTVRHNKLSVRPHLCFDTVTKPDQPISLVIRNTGLGPAVIVGFEVFLDGKVVENEPFESLVEAKNRIGLHPFTWNCFIPLLGDALASNEKIELLAFPNSAKDEFERKMILDRINRISFRLKYESMYRVKFCLEGNPVGPIQNNSSNNTIQPTSSVVG